MGNPTYSTHVKLIASLICQEEESFYTALNKMVTHWNSPDFISETMSFDYTDYYEKEMGKNLWRRMVGFETLISPDSIPAIKLLTNDIETELLPEPNTRKVNIDPGYINAYHLILATTKPCPHRPYLRDGIYADLTLIYRDKTFQALPWTYPDYRSDKLIIIMNKLRQKYLFQLKRKPFSESRNLKKESL